jgi:hypothetical protein
VLGRLTTPRKIQDYLDRLPYNTDPEIRAPRGVIRHRKAHCMDGAVFAAAALQNLRHPPLLVDLRAYRDDDHVLAVYKRSNLWGALAKSNFVGLRYREPVYRSLRELVMSFFEQYYNLDGLKSLREYSQPLNLRRFDRLDWLTNDSALLVIEKHLDSIRHYRLLPPGAARALSKIDRRSYRAGMQGVVMSGVYRP